MRYGVATLPHNGGDIQFLPVKPGQSEEDVTNRGRHGFYIKRTGPRQFIVFTNNGTHHLFGEALGRLDEGQFGTTGRPWVVIFAGADGTLEKLQELAAGDSDYLFEFLEDAWVRAAFRTFAKGAANPIRWATGEFPPVPGSTYGRPQLRHVPAGQTWDPYAPTDEELP